ncbi:MAG: DUF4388 domain-containing protein [Planctomycetes bacterium]|nr:DUF4388 domain-containing protein [Planctomycetota bacterium]
MKFQGDIHSIPIADVAQNLAANRKSGVLTMRRGQEVRRILFRDGKILSYSDNTGFSIPRWIEEKGIVDSKVLEKALVRYKKTRKKTLGEILDESEVIKKEEYLEYVHDLVKELLFETFTFRDGTFEFSEYIKDPNAFDREIIGAGIELPVGPVIMEAARRIDDWEAIRKCLPSENDIYQIPAAEKESLLKEYEEDEVTQAAVELLDGTRAIREVIAKIPASRFEACQAIAELVGKKRARPVDGMELLEQFPGDGTPEERARTLVRLKAALEREPGNRVLLQKVAELSLAEEKKDDAATYFKLLALAHLDGGDLEGAEEGLRQSIELNPKDIGAWQKLYDIIEQRDADSPLLTFGTEMAKHLRGLGLEELARDHLSRMIARFPTQKNLRFEHAETLFALGDKAGAIDRLLEMARDGLRKGLLDIAERALAKVIEYDRDHKRAKEIYEKIRSGKLERQRARRKILLRASSAALILAFLGFFIGYDLFARREFAITTRQVLAEGLIERGEYDKALHRLEEVRNRHPVSLLKFLEAKEIIEVLKRAAEQKRNPNKDVPLLPKLKN